MGPVNVDVPVGQIEVSEVMVDTPYEVPNPVFVDVPVEYPVEVEGPPIIEHVVADPIIDHVVADVQQVVTTPTVHRVRGGVHYANPTQVSHVGHYVSSPLIHG